MKQTDKIKVTYVQAKNINYYVNLAKLTTTSQIGQFFHPTILFL